MTKALYRVRNSSSASVFTLRNVSPVSYLEALIRRKENFAVPHSIYSQELQVSMYLVYAHVRTETKGLRSSTGTFLIRRLVRHAQQRLSYHLTGRM